MRTYSMRNTTTFLALTAVLLVLGAGSAAARSGAGEHGTAARKLRTDTIAVPAMQCGMCEERITERLRKIAAIRSVHADAEAKRVVVTYDPRRIRLAEIERRVAAIGYDAGGARAVADAQRALPMCCRPHAEH